MAKYIIEFEDEPYMREDGVNYYTCKSARWYKLGDTIINSLTPYTESDRKAIEDEVWEFCRMIDCDVDGDDLDELYGDYDEFYTKYTYQEAKTKYEAWKKQKDEIHVGDEVEDNDGTRGIVFGINGTDLLGVCWEDERMGHFFWPKTYCRKTGRHFSEAERLLEALKTK